MTARAAHPARLLAFAVAAALALVAMLAAPSVPAAHAGAYSVWSCGASSGETMPPPSAGAVDYRTVNRVFGHYATGSATISDDVCPSDTGDQGFRSGVFTAATIWNGGPGCSAGQIVASCWPGVSGETDGFGFNAPAGTGISAIQVRQGGRSTIPAAVNPNTGVADPDGYHIDGLDKWQWRPELLDEAGTRGWVVGYIQNSDPNKERSEFDCSGARQSGDVSCMWQNSSLFASFTADELFGKPTVGGLNFRLRCDPYNSVAGYTNRCPVYSGTMAGAPYYGGRVNMRAIRITITDNQPPTLASGGDIASATYVKGDGHQLVGAVTGDNSAVRRMVMSVTRDATGAVMSGTDRDIYSFCADNEVRDSAGMYGNTWLVSNPCEPIGNETVPVSTTSWPDGAYTGTVSGWDVAGNPSTFTHGFVVDNTEPVEDSCPNGVPNITAPTGVVAPDGKHWVRDRVTINAKACDRGTGLAQSKIQFSLDGSSWNDVCTDNTTSAPGQTINVSCDFNTVPHSTGTYSQGQQVYFRLWMKDGAGNTGETAATPVRSMDNTAEPVSAVTFTAPHALGAWSHKASSPAAWTNANKITAEWQPVTTGGGSPIAAINTEYRPGPQCAGIPTQLGGDATSLVVKGIDTRSPDCGDDAAQGRHAILVWSVDLVGNESRSAPISSTAEFSWDNRAPELSGSGRITVDPGNYTRANRFRVTVRAMPTFDGVTTSPTAQIAYTVGESATRTLANCADGSFASGALCSIGSVNPADDNSSQVERRPVTVPASGGQYPVRLWLVDLAGNQSRENSAVDTAHYDDALCVRTG